MTSAEDLESVEATLELLADAEALRRVEQARHYLDAGRGTTAEQMAEFIAARRERGA
jgi:PHD/YefM family antitoxin component YafN of YafNO toxin-antitoxin module